MSFSTNIDQTSLLSPKEQQISASSPSPSSATSSPLTKRELAFQKENELVNEGNLQIDPEFENLQQNARVKFFLHEIQTIHIGKKYRDRRVSTVLHFHDHLRSSLHLESRLSVRR